MLSFMTFVLFSSYLL